MKAKTFFISLSVFALITIISIGAMVYFNTNKNSPDSTQNNTTPTITPSALESRVVGYIYSSGLSSGPAYQLTYLTKQSSLILPEFFAEDIEGIFLIGDQTVITGNWGKCVQVVGTMGPEINTKGLAENFYRLNMDVKNITPSTECLISLDNFPEYEQVIKTYSGTVEKNIRPMPDIGYDFRLVLNTPYQDTHNAAGLEITVTEIIIVPLTETVFNSFNNSIGQTVTVTGEWTTGFAESEFLLVNAIN